MAGNVWWDYWWFQLPNYAVSVVIYTLFGRFMLGFVLPPDSGNYIWRWFRRLTDPFLRAAAFVTPLAVPGLFLAPIAALWLFVLRVAAFAALAAYGLTPQLAAGPAG
jgi:uncharacterized protein YggT (Ycf19 family)